MPPMWSSWPWVSTRPTTCLWRSRTYVKSGRTRSTPSISSVGNMSPVSRIRILSSCSERVMFRPISPTPPRKTTLVRPAGATRPALRPALRERASPSAGFFAGSPAGSLAGSCAGISAGLSAGSLAGSLAGAAGLPLGVTSSYQSCRTQRLADLRHLIGGGVEQREAGGSGRVPDQLHRGLDGDRVGGDAHRVVNAEQTGVDLL